MMAKNKKYYWLKLKDDFFTQKEIKRLRKIAGGDTYTIIYLKLLLLSLKNEGRIYFDGIGDNFTDELSLELDEDEENIQITLNYLKSKKLLEIIEDDELYLSNIASMIGSETDSAIRKRRQRDKEKLPNRDVVTLDKDIVTNKSRVGHTEIEIEIEKDIDIDIEQEQEKETSDAPAADNSKLNAQTFYQQNFGVANSIIIQSIDMWIDDLNEELVIEAMRRAALNESGFKYAEGIMKNWDKKGLKTLEEVKAEDVSFENKKSRNTNSNDSNQSDSKYAGFF